MLATISILTALQFAVLYPLCFWIHHDEPLRQQFHKFHLGLPNFIAGVSVICLLFFPTIPLELKCLLVGWKIGFLTTSRIYWRRDTVDPRVISVLCATGFALLMMVQQHLVAAVSPAALLSSLLGGLVLCTTVFAMNLGHWYLNVTGLDLRHLMRAVHVLGAVLGLRLMWDVIMLGTLTVRTPYEALPLYRFIFSVEGFLIWVAIIFGTIFPLITVYFVKGTLKARSTQSATGILYAMLCAVLMGHLSYQYFLVQYHLPL